MGPTLTDHADDGRGRPLALELQQDAMAVDEAKGVQRLTLLGLGPLHLRAAAVQDGATGGDQDAMQGCRLLPDLAKRRCAAGLQQPVQQKFLAVAVRAADVQPQRVHLELPPAGDLDDVPRQLRAGASVPRPKRSPDAGRYHQVVRALAEADAQRAPVVDQRRVVDGGQLRGPRLEVVPFVPPPGRDQIPSRPSVARTLRIEVRVHPLHECLLLGEAPARQPEVHAQQAAEGLDDGLGRKGPVARQEPLLGQALRRQRQRIDPRRRIEARTRAGSLAVAVAGAVAGVRGEEAARGCSQSPELLGTLGVDHRR
mmetsp:Transcript_144141/g.461464  ORF Transcript_144141/g.461464 Transcript_144141/m.461464 type:complete len:312 (+) Transcript_144141:682-1617(+)